MRCRTLRDHQHRPRPAKTIVQARVSDKLGLPARQTGRPTSTGNWPRPDRAHSGPTWLSRRPTCRSDSEASADGRTSWQRFREPSASVDNWPSGDRCPPLGTGAVVGSCCVCQAEASHETLTATLFRAPMVMKIGLDWPATPAATRAPSTTNSCVGSNGRQPHVCILMRGLSD